MITFYTNEVFQTLSSSPGADKDTLSKSFYNLWNSPISLSIILILCHHVRSKLLTGNTWQSGTFLSIGRSDQLTPMRIHIEF